LTCARAATARPMRRKDTARDERVRVLSNYHPPYELTGAVEAAGPNALVVHVGAHHRVQNLLLLFAVVDLLAPESGRAESIPARGRRRPD